VQGGPPHGESEKGIEAEHPDRRRRQAQGASARPRGPCAAFVIAEIHQTAYRYVRRTVSLAAEVGTIYPVDCRYNDTI
jgi:hypothetical protein